MNGKELSQGEGRFPDVRTTANLFAFGCQVLAVSTEVFLRTGFGPRYLGLQAGAAALAIPCFSILFPYEDTRPLLWFFMSYIGMCFLCRAGAVNRARRGETCHSRYNGRPLIARVLPWISEATIKRMVEPALVFGIGLGLAEVNLPLGSYLMLSAFGLAATMALLEAHERQRVMDLYDGFIDQTVIAERFRQMRGIGQRL